jgi:hypothetical protein
MERLKRFDPDLRVVFEPGNHEHAVNCYTAGRDWLIRTGIAEREGLYGFLYAPKHPKVPATAKYAPIGLITEPLWSVQIEIQVDSDDTLAWLGGVKLPENAWFEMILDLI